MRFMLLIKSNDAAEAGQLPSRELVEAMEAFNRQMAEAGVLLMGEGLQPSSRGARITYSQGRRTVTDGPFPEAKELVAGFWLINVASKEEAVAWALRCPLDAGETTAAAGEVGQIEVRPIFEFCDLPDELLGESPATATAGQA
jgi:hypothetical protein